ncbi:hypothetical protein PT276_02590 [Orbaceae bacterium ESL0721]|nr:hypothetical protein [Orbaceae bacterium ESL0721]
MKQLLNQKKVSLQIFQKLPFLFWASLLSYIIVICLLLLSKRKPDYNYQLIIGLTVLAWFNILFCFYIIFRQQEKTKKLKQWLASNFFKSKLNKKSLHSILILSNYGLLIGATAFLCLLLNVKQEVCFCLFALQIILAVIVFFYFFKDFYKQFLLKKWLYVSIFTIVQLCLSLICEIYSGYFVTNLFYLFPKDLPLVTRGIHWFIFIILCSYLVQLLVVYVFGNIKNRRIPISLSMSAYLLSILVACSIWVIFFANTTKILNQIVILTYQSDMVGYFRCNNGEIVKGIPNETARYLKVDEQEYRVLYKTDDSIRSQAIICEGQNYKLIDI